MSDHRPPPHADPHGSGGDFDDGRPSGCLATVGSLGLAMYALLVLSMACAGLTCGGAVLVGTTLNFGAEQNELTSGQAMDPFALIALRNRGIVPDDVTPALIHVEDRAGMAGCLVIGTELLRWNAGVVSQRVELSGATVETTGPDASPTVIVSQDGRRVACPFGPDEGGDRFHRMLSAEARR